MQELGIDIEQVLPWFPHETETPYVLVRVSAEHTNDWAVALRDAVRRCYLTDELLKKRVEELEQEIGGTPESRQSLVISSKLPDAGSIMAGDFGEILVYLYQASKAYPHNAFGPKKWRLKEARTKAAPYSDVVHFILPTWPAPCEQDKILCAEVKMKSTNSASSPIENAITFCAKDRTSRLSNTLQWLKDRAIGESLGAVEISQLDRFINTIDNPPATRCYYAIAVICSNLLEAELPKAPLQASPEYTLIVIVVPNLHAIYSAVFDAVKKSTLP